MAQTKTAEKTQHQSGPQQQQGQANMTKPQDQVAQFYAPRLLHHPYIEKEYGIDKAKWKALVEAIFPNATNSDAVLLALSYCKARNLDIFKRPVHIVAIWSKAEKRMIDSVWPGIGELRTTAHRTNEYAGHDETVLGPIVEKQVGNVMMRFPEWMQMTVYRFVQGTRCAFPGPKVYWLETYATAGRDDDTPNEMWRNRPFGQLDKCSEAASLRSGFPEELGGEYIPEEIERGATYGAIPAKAQVIADGQSRASQLVDRMKERAADPIVEEVRREPAQEQQRDPDSDDGPLTAKALTARINVATTLDQVTAIEADIPKVEPPEDREGVFYAIDQRKKQIAELTPAKHKGELPLS